MAWLGFPEGPAPKHDLVYDGTRRLDGYRYQPVWRPEDHPCAVRDALKTQCSLCATGMNSFTDPDTGKKMHARNGTVVLCSAQKTSPSLAPRISASTPARFSGCCRSLIARAGALHDRTEADHMNWRHCGLGGDDVPTSKDETLLRADLAAALAHRGCCGSEHDPANGKLHGYCVVCGVPWPCDTAKFFMRSASETAAERCPGDKPRSPAMHVRRGAFGLVRLHCENIGASGTSATHSHERHLRARLPRMCG